MIPLKVKSTKFIQELQARRDSFNNQAQIKASITVPDSLMWWRWIEFGTASRADPGFGSGQNYDIDPVNKMILAWTSDSGEGVFAHHISHPGIYPRHFVQKVLDQIVSETGESVSQSMYQDGKIRAENILSGLDQGISNAKELISQSLAAETKSVPRTDAYGKGATAQTLWDDNAIVVHSDGTTSSY